MISLATIVERTAEPLVTVDFNGDERDPAWCAFCESGYWRGEWHHADDYAEESGYLPGVDGWPTDSPAWHAAVWAAKQAAQDEGDAHRADVHHDN